MLNEQSLLSLPGYALRRAANATAADLTARLDRIGIRLVDATVLMLIADNPGTTSSAVGKVLDIQRANMVPLLKRLEDAGLIEREPIDRKSQGIAVTAGGKARLAEVRRVIAEFEAELIERVPQRHRDHLLPALNALWR